MEEEKKPEDETVPVEEPVEEPVKPSEEVPAEGDVA